MTTTATSRGIAAHHNEWLALVEVSGPFLTLPVLKRALPQGLEPTDPDLTRQLRLAYDEWQADPGLHHRWVRWVLSDVLDFDEATLVDGPALPPQVIQHVGEHGVTLRPDLAVIDPGEDTPRLLVRALPRGMDLDDPVEDDRWAATPLQRMVELCRASGVRLGLVTNGQTWTLVDAPQGGPSAFATWDAAVWIDERLSLDAFRTLLGAHRFFAVAEADTLEALLAESAEAEHEVTDQLGYQVRQAVELLVDAFGRADRNSGGQLLDGVPADQVYEAAVTVMMRTVFLLAAEERHLLPLTDHVYQQSYAVSPLHSQLREQADQHGEEPLERRSTAWHRLLATFRMVHAGVAHENLRLPAYGGSLFDPDRFSFLEGRQPDEPWQADPGRPLPVDDRTVLAILHAVQVLKFRQEARRLSFRALDVEQIGHVYEGLLDHTAYYAEGPVLGLTGKHEAELAAEDLTAYDPEEDRDELVDWLKEEAGLTTRQAEKRLDADADAQEQALLRAACDNDDDLFIEIEPYAGLLRRDLRGLHQVWLPGSVYVTSGTARRSTGTYYTPRVLAEEMVHHTLEPLCYHPGSADGADPEDWQLRPAYELLDLRVCDMAMGSGAFLVAACRYLAERLLDAWESAQHATGDEVTIFGDPAADAPDAQLVPADAEDRRILARRVVADRCLFGVDKNPMAVEMAKLSLWLITLAKDRPFSFLDHALRCGDSLLGVTELAQLEHLHPDPNRGRQLHEGTLFDYQATWAPAVKEAIERRRQLESFTVVTVEDAEHKARLHREADEALETLRIIGDVVIGAAIATVNHGDDTLDGTLLDVAEDVAKALDPDTREADRDVRVENFRNRAAFWLDTGRPDTAFRRETLHWPLEFPEIFLDRVQPGFDAIIGNPPFLGWARITETQGDAYNTFLGHHFPPFSKRVDLVAYFFRMGAYLLRNAGIIGLLATNTISQGTTRQGGLDVLLDKDFTIIRARRSFAWPGRASIVASALWLRQGTWGGSVVLDGNHGSTITRLLEFGGRHSELVPLKLEENKGLCYTGSGPWGSGFYIDPATAGSMLQHDPENADVVRKAAGGQDINNSSPPRGSRWVVNMGERDETEARKYTWPFQYLEYHLKGWRTELDANKYRRVVGEWWKYFHPRITLYRSIEERRLTRVLARARVSDHHMLTFLANDLVYLDTVIVFLFDDIRSFGVLQSGLHELWARRYASTLKRDMRYGAGNCFDTFPWPEDVGAIEAPTQELYHKRDEYMRKHGLGLTQTYNRINSPNVGDEYVVDIRELHEAVDYAVADAYGWSDLWLAHGFWATRQGTRFTIGEVAGTEVLDRLLELNHARYAEEVRRGLHDRKTRSGPRAPHGQLGLGTE
jgi:hypothetical protein